MSDVSVILPVLRSRPWHGEMARAAVRSLRTETAESFRLVVVEAGEAPDEWLSSAADRYEFAPGRRTVVEDINTALALCDTDLVVFTGTDIFVGPRWLEALLETWRDRPDVGAVTLAETVDMKQPAPLPIVTEGWYGPFMLWSRTQYPRLDPGYEAMWSDNDLIAQIYADGRRCYRSHVSYVTHLSMMTWRTGYAQAERDRIYQAGRERFLSKWGSSPLWAIQMILRGQVVWGREHEAYRT